MDRLKTAPVVCSKKSLEFSRTSYGRAINLMQSVILAWKELRRGCHSAVPVHETFSSYRKNFLRRYLDIQRETAFDKAAAKKILYYRRVITNTLLHGKKYYIGSGFFHGKKYSFSHGLNMKTWENVEFFTCAFNVRRPVFSFCCSRPRQPATPLAY